MRPVPRAPRDSELRLVGPGESLQSDGWLERLRSVEETRTGDRIGRFEIVDEIGRGGQGVVYRAIDPETGALVAVKKLRIGSGGLASVRRRLENELQAVQSLDHPGVVRLRGIESDGTSPLLVMDWVDGVPPTEWAQARPRSSKEIVRLVVAITEVLLHAHQRGVIHRDLKPSNVLVDSRSEPHLLDFGLAKLDYEESSSFHQSGRFLGTLAYASPEMVLHGPETVDARSDVYALGILLYELLAGELPYDLGTSISTAVNAIVEADVPRLRSRGVDRRLEAIVSKSLAKRTENRYQSADALRADLQRYLMDEPIEAHVANAWDTLGQFARKHRVATASLAAIPVFLLSVAVTMTVLYRQSESRAEVARRIEAFAQSARDPMHSRESLRELSRQAGVVFAGSPMGEASARNELAQLHADRNEWQEVAEQSRLAAALLERNEMTHDSEYIIALANLGMANSFLTRNESGSLLERAIQLEESKNRPDPFLLGELHSKLASIRWSVTRPAEYESAIEHYRKSFHWFELNGEPNWEWAEALMECAQMNRELSRPVISIRAYEKADAILDELPGDYGPEKIQVYECLANAHSMLRSWEEAERYYRQAIEIRGGTTDNGYPATLSMLGSSILQQGQFEEAIEYYHAAMVARLELLAEMQPEARDEYLAVRATILEDGFMPETVLPMGYLFAYHSPRLYPNFRHTAGRIADAYDLLDRVDTADAIRSELRDLDLKLVRGEDLQAASR